MTAATAAELSDSRAPAPAECAPTFEVVYAECFDFVWRSARRLGVPERATDDVVQEVFLVVHRRLAEFEGRSSVRSWVFGILMKVVSDYRRRYKRKDAALTPMLETLKSDLSSCPVHKLEQRQKVELLNALLATLNEHKRVVFVLAELEQMSAPEIADLLGVNLNTVYSRLRAARQEFDRALMRVRKAEGAKAEG